MGRWAGDVPDMEKLGALAGMLDRVPLFVLPDVVLFPHALVPLHLQEQRDIDLARDVVSSSRLVAVALRRRPPAIPGEPIPFHRVAAVGEVVMAHELPDGELNLVVRGRARVHIDRELATGESYRLIRASLFPELTPAAGGEVLEADRTLRVLVQQLADTLEDGGELLRDVMSVQETPLQLANVLSAALVVDLGARQTLLETSDVVRRIEQVSTEVASMIARILPSADVN